MKVGNGPTRFTFVLVACVGSFASDSAWAGWSSINLVSPQYVDTNPPKGIAPGKKVTVHCKWKTVGTIPIHTNWPAYKKLKDLDFKVPGEITLDGKHLLDFQVYITGPDKVIDAVVDWIAGNSGKHAGTCSIDPKNIAGVQSVKTIQYEIEVVQPHAAPTTTVGAAGRSYLAPGTKHALGNTGPVNDIQPMAAPDLTATNNLTVGGKTVSWGGEVLLNADQAIAKYATAGGQCAFNVSYGLRNQGLSPSGTFTSRWKSSKSIEQLVSIASIGPGATQSLQAVVKFSAGSGALGLAIDSGGTVTETNEKNNQFGIRTSVNGSCMPGAR